MKVKRNLAQPLIASTVMSTLLLAPLSGLAGDAMEGSSSARRETSYQDAMFKRLDRDHDGYISRSEATREPHFIDPFRQSDDNHDDRLSTDEYVKARAIYDRQRVADYAEDSLITAKVKAALVKDPVVNALDVSVETTHGEVLLSGFVDDDKQAERARELAARVDGVRRVHTNLVVKG